MDSTVLISCEWLISLIIMSSRFIYDISMYQDFIIIFHCMTQPRLFIHPSTAEHGGASTPWLLWNTGMQIALPDSASNSGYIHRVWNTDHKAVVFFLSHLHTVFHSGYAILKSYQERTQVPVSPYLCKYLVSSLFLIKQSASSDVWDFLFLCLGFILL